jgi:hypothetical protein
VVRFASFEFWWDSNARQVQLSFRGLKPPALSGILDLHRWYQVCDRWEMFVALTRAGGEDAASTAGQEAGVTSC